MGHCKALIQWKPLCPCPELQHNVDRNACSGGFPWRIAPLLYWDKRVVLLLHISNFEEKCQFWWITWLDWVVHGIIYPLAYSCRYILFLPVALLQSRDAMSLYIWYLQIKHQGYPKCVLHTFKSARAQWTTKQPQLVFPSPVLASATGRCESQDSKEVGVLWTADRINIEAQIQIQTMNLEDLQG